MAMISPLVGVVNCRSLLTKSVGRVGGVFFSLADYALAVASNVNQPPSASTNSSIAHMRRVKGNKLKAVAHPDKLGRNLAFFTIDLFDEPGNLVARMSATVMRTNH